MHPQFILTAITSDPQVVRAASAAGLERIGIDIERLGKAARQGHIPHARISAPHTSATRAVAAGSRCSRQRPTGVLLIVPSCVSNVLLPFHGFPEL